MLHLGERGVQPVIALVASQIGASRLILKSRGQTATPGHGCHEQARCAYYNSQSEDSQDVRCTGSFAVHRPSAQASVPILGKDGSALPKVAG
jgi:hypothetical protein